jgi:hypothetical protein
MSERILSVAQAFTPGLSRSKEYSAPFMGLFNCGNCKSLLKETIDSGSEYFPRRKRLG